MPYICLARSDIPDGVLQVLDLAPNSSQAIPSLSPPGETRYINRVKTGTAVVTAGGTLDQSHLDGLSAYLIDNVEPGGLLNAAGTITILGTCTAGDQITIGGAVFTAVAALPDHTIREFQDASGSAAACATDLILAINNTTAVTGGRTVMKASTAGGKPVNAYALAADGGAGIVSLTARSSTGGDHALVGWAGNTIALATTEPTHITLSDARLTRGLETWTLAAQATATAALVARLDAGSALNLTGINTALSSVGSELTNAGGSSSRGSVANVLACLAGRTYRIARTSITGAANYYMDATYPTYKFNQSSALGGFEQMVYINGDVMQYGEWKTAAIGGDLVAREVGGIRHTYNVDALSASLLGGQLKSMTGPTELWPNSEVIPHFPWGQAGFLSYDTTTAPRLVVVYDDDGTVLS